MRSISWKLMLAFVVVSLAGTGLFYGIAKYNSSREIQNFLVNQDQSRIIDYLTAYYAATGSWEGLDQKWLEGQLIPPPNQAGPGPSSPFILVNAQKMIVHGRGGWPAGWQTGIVVTDKDLENALQITLDGQTIGWLVIPTPNPREIFENQPILKRIDILLIYSAGGSLLIALVLGVLLSKNLSRPLQQLSSAARQAATGDLSQKVEVNSKDEIGVLAESFNQMMNDLERLIAARKQMTADIAHELRTPISVILGHAEGVYEGVMEPTLENFEIIRDEALHLERLVNDLRVLSQADVGALPLEIQPVAADKLISEIVRAVNPALREKEITLDIKIDPDLPPMIVDRDRILQVIRNILDNAVRYTPQGGKITLQADTIDGKWARFSIQDSGPGINPDELPRIFDRFYQADSARTRDQRGSGLGLAIAKSIIEQHGGAIQAESPVNEGLKLNFDLPVQAD